MDDAEAAQKWFPHLEGQPVGQVERMFADSKYHNYALYEWVEDNARWEMDNSEICNNILQKGEMCLKNKL